MDGAQQIGQAWSVGDVVAVAIHDLAQQRHLFDALSNQGTNFGRDFAHRPAALSPTPVGDDAEGADVVAAVHDGDVS